MSTFECSIEQVSIKMPPPCFLEIIIRTSFGRPETQNASLSNCFNLQGKNFSPNTRQSLELNEEIVFLSEGAASKSETLSLKFKL